MLSQSLSDTVKLESILGRLDDLPRFLKSAQKLLKEPPQIWILLADEEIDNMVGFLNDIVGLFRPQAFPQRRRRTAGENGDRCRHALEDFSDFLDTLKTKEGSTFRGRQGFLRQTAQAAVFPRLRL